MGLEGELESKAKVLNTMVRELAATAQAKAEQTARELSGP